MESAQVPLKIEVEEGGFFGVRRTKIPLSGMRLYGWNQTVRQSFFVQKRTLTE